MGCQTNFKAEGGWEENAKQLDSLMSWAQNKRFGQVVFILEGRSVRWDAKWAKFTNRWRCSFCHKNPFNFSTCSESFSFTWRWSVMESDLNGK